MKRLTWAWLLIVVSLTASAQEHRGGPPEQFSIWSDASSFIVAQREGGAYVGFISDGFWLGWNFKIDDWSLEHIKVTGTSNLTQFDGSHQVVIVEGKPDIIKDGIAHCKARYSVGHGWKSRKVKVTWDVPPPKLTGLWVH